MFHTKTFDPNLFQGFQTEHENFKSMVREKAANQLFDDYENEP
jgi:hypothetical protein